MRQHPSGRPGDRAAGRLTSRPRPAPGRSPSAAPAGSDVHRLGSSAGRAPLLVGPAGPRPLVVFFHGAGGRAEQSLVLVEEVATQRGLLVLLPSSAGSTWDLLSGGLGPDAASLDGALAEVFAAYDVQGVACAGFSDGGSYALSVGLANGDLVEAVLAFSPGFAAPPVRVGAPRVFISHGDADAVLPVDRCGRRVAGVLAGAGYDVRYREFSGGHVVPPELVREAVGWWLGPDHRG